MTLRTWLMALERGLRGDQRGGCKRLRRADWNRGSTTDDTTEVEWSRWHQAATRAVFVFLKQTRTLDEEKKLISSPWSDFNTVTQLRGSDAPLIRGRPLWARRQWILVFWSADAAAALEKHLGTQMEFIAIAIIVGAKKKTTKKTCAPKRQRGGKHLETPDDSLLLLVWMKNNETYFFFCPC